MTKQEIMKELLDRYQQLDFADRYTKELLLARINKLELMLKEML